MVDEFEMPYSREAEVAVIGAIFRDTGVLDQARSAVSSLSFFVPAHQSIFAAFVELTDQNMPIDVITVTNHLQSKKQLDRVGGVSYLSRVASSSPTAANIEQHAEIVKARHLQRQTIRVLQEQLQAAWQTDDALDVITDMQTAASTLADQAAASKEFQPIKDVVMSAFEMLEHRYAHSGDEVTGVPSGYTDLDRLTSGWQDGDFVVVAARPSVGKTAFALNVSQHAAIRHKKRVALFSLEMSAPQLVMRMMSAEQHVDANRMRTGFLRPEDWERITDAVSVLSDAGLHIDDSAAITVQDIRSKCRRLKKREGLDLIVIDYLQLITGIGHQGNRQQEVSEISRTLKQIARELKVPVIALSQLSRGVEQRQDKRPMMSDLRESGAIEQDADIVAFLYRDDYYNADTEKKNIIEIILAKQRNGPIGTAELVFMKEFNKFINYERYAVETPAIAGHAVPDMYRR